jgi:diaminohydroxyphosphoribosylaminopyrimidine deaminase/5-amino-6-(5-phosphoribosylamino)uracil reductase
VRHARVTEQIEAGGDASHMSRALELAQRGLGLAAPNPMVGAVVVVNGQVVAEGWHEGPGTRHAEIRALDAAGDRARGATLYVTLEPCTHQGRTPPCAPAVADAGIARVVAAIRDPNPAVDGRGLAFLRAADIQVTEGVLAEEAGRIIAGFAKHVRTGLPFVTLKMAASLDGKVASRDGSSRWITGEAARLDVHRLRAASGAIAVGVGTILADDSALTVRLDGFPGRPPWRVVLDSRGRTPTTAVVLDGSAPTLIATTPACPSSILRSWEQAGAEVWVIEESEEEWRVSLLSVLELLGKREVQDVLLEGGPTLAWSSIERGLVDRLVLYLGPKLLGGGGASLLGGEGVRSIGEALPLRLTEVERIGDDLKVVADVHRDR